MKYEKLETMIAVTSNAGRVAQQLRRFQEGLPAALGRAAAPGYWRPRLEATAAKTLRAIWALERDLNKRELYERLTPKIVGTMIAETFEGGVRFELSLPQEAQGSGGLDLAGAAAFNLGMKTPTGRTSKFALQEEEALNHLDAVRQAIVDWVTLEKRRDPERDTRADGTPLSDEELAERIMEILGVNERAVPRARTPEMDAAAASLTTAINTWLEGDGETPPTAAAAQAGQGGGPTITRPGLDAATAAEWFRAVLLAWTSLLAGGLPERARMEIQKWWDRCQAELV